MPDATATTRQASLRDLPLIRRLAREIWLAHYPGILSMDQTEYMLARMYALDVLREEMASGGVCFFLREGQGGDALGFASVGPTAKRGESKLHKLYVQPSAQGRGHGYALLETAAAQARSQGSDSLSLCVNKRNEQAVAAYLRYGFTIRESIKVDIGGGYVMDDYVMAKTLDPG
ncbi:MAG: GNAT family N-acetyltransferase [Verrucomicrobia bacterium]|nr:GNAT family N-acetyltransferase [Verrucomicrobiota bacterium]MBI3868364.1 GNAT family N-acetyltransferase [Verrucomicrobiota bacterium]